MQKQENVKAEQLMRVFGIEPTIAAQMRKMYVGETLYIKTMNSR